MCVSSGPFFISTVLKQPLSSLQHSKLSGSQQPQQSHSIAFPQSAYKLRMLPTRSVPMQYSFNEPDSPLLFPSNIVCRLRSLEKSGIVPVKQLSCKLSFSSFSNCSKDLGIGPEMDPPSKLSSERVLENSDNSCGRVPARPFHPAARIQFEKKKMVSQTSFEHLNLHEHHNLRTHVIVSVRLFHCRCK